MATFSFLWDSAYESTPTQGLNRNQIDNRLRQLWTATRERMGAEHNFGPYTDLDDGSHIRGGTTVALKDDLTARDALTDMENGALFCMEDGSDVVLCVFVTGTGWVEVSSLDHASLLNLDVNVHTQYLLRSGGTMTGDLDMGGQHLLMPDVQESQMDLLQYRHANLYHPSPSNLDAIKANVILIGKMRRTQKSSSGQTDAFNGVYRYQLLADNTTDFMFMPNVWTDGREDDSSIVAATGGLYPGLALVISQSIPGLVDWRINLEYLY